MPEEEENSTPEPEPQTSYEGVADNSGCVPCGTTTGACVHPTWHGFGRGNPIDPHAGRHP